jgi:hypothetical protein
MCYSTHHPRHFLAADRSMFLAYYLGEIRRGAISDRQITVIAMRTHNVRGERSLVAEDARANVTLVGLLLRRRLFVQRIKV